MISVGFSKEKSRACGANAWALTRGVSRADDLVQDTLVRAIAKQDFWQRGTSLRAWLFTLMHNQNVKASGAACAKA